MNMNPDFLEKSAVVFLFVGWAISAFATIVSFVPHTATPGDSNPQTQPDVV